MHSSSSISKHDSFAVLKSSLCWFRIRSSIEFCDDDDDDDDDDDNRLVSTKSKISSTISSVFNFDFVFIASVIHVAVVIVDIAIDVDFNVDVDFLNVDGCIGIHDATKEDEVEDELELVMNSTKRKVNKAVVARRSVTHILVFILLIVTPSTSPTSRCRCRRRRRRFRLSCCPS